MSWRAAVVALLLIETAAALVVPVRDSPRLIASTAGNVDVVPPVGVLHDGRVRKQLSSGLTTAFVITVDSRIVKNGAVRIEVRYELWDESYLVVTTDASGARHRMTFRTFDSMREWWQAARLPLGRLESGAKPAAMKVEMDLIPFSAGEEEDAKRWLAHSIGEAAGPSPSTSHSGSSSESAGGNILGMVIGTSMHRRAVQSWRWTTPLERP